MASLTTKTCRKCMKALPCGDFSKRSASRDGLQPKCKPCSADAYRLWVKVNPLKRRELDRACYKARPDKKRARERARRQANLETFREYGRAYQKTPKGRAVRRATNGRHRAQKRSTALVNENVSGVIHRWTALRRVHCHLCGKSVTDWHVDHIIPLARGGTHTVGNIAPACPACNLSKGSKLPNQFLKKGQLVLL